MTSPHLNTAHDSNYSWSLRILTVLQPEQWGLSFEGRTNDAPGHAYPSHITTARTCTVEGVLAVSRCVACAGRHQLLLDFRGLSDLERDEMDRAIASIEANAEITIGQWAAVHTQCSIVPRQHEACAEVELVLQTEHATAVADLRAAEPLANELLVLMDDRSIFCLPLVEVSPITNGDSRRELAMVIHSFHATIREHTRLTGTRPLAAVFVGDAWPSMLTGHGGGRNQAAGQPEFLTVMAATPEAVMLGVAPITRASGTPRIGPGEVGRLTFDLARTASPITDGLFASSCEA